MNTVRAEDAEKFYTEVVDAKMGEDYEEARWHKDARSHALYEMTKDSISALLLERKDFSCTSCCELGPGAATWTKELVSHFPQATYDFVDISSVMLEKTKKIIEKLPLSARFFVSEFNAYTPDREYNLFFSIRAFEYVADKTSAVARISSMLTKGGRGFILTKTPHYTRAALRGRRYSSLHTGQISPSALQTLCVKEGLQNIEVYPVTFTFPLLQSPRLDMFLYKVFGRRKLSRMSAFFSESYVITFTKS